MTPAPQAVRSPKPQAKKAAAAPPPAPLPEKLTPPKKVNGVALPLRPGKALAKAPQKKAAAKPQKKAAAKKGGTPKTVRSATPAPAAAPAEEQLPPMPPMPEGPMIAGAEEDLLEEVNNIMGVLRAGLSVLPEPENQMQRMQALYFGFLNTTVQLGLDMEVPVERLLEDMAECVTRAEYVRASEAELAAMEQMEQQQLQQQG